MRNIFRQLTALLFEWCLLLVPELKVSQCVLVVHVGGRNDGDVFWRQDFRIQGRAYFSMLKFGSLASWRVTFVSQHFTAYA